MSEPTVPSGPLATFVLGLRVLADELAWLALRGLRALETRQLRKQLAREYAEEGRLAAARPGTADEAAQVAEQRELARRQIEFLKEEIALLERELAAKRAELLAQRLERWKLNRGESN